jgi:hypothetical protein
LALRRASARRFGPTGAAPGAEIALPDPLLSGEQPWWIVSDDPALFGSNLGDLVDADQQQRPAEQACPHLQHLGSFEPTVAF